MGDIWKGIFEGECMRVSLKLLVLGRSGDVYYLMERMSWLMSTLHLVGIELGTRSVICN